MEKRMVWLGLVVMVVGLCSSGAFATTMGPPVAGLDAGKFSVGIDYSKSDISLDGDGKIKLHVESTLLADPVNTSESIEFEDDFESDMYFANIGYGVSDKLEVFARLGMADLTSEGYDGGSEFAWGLGAKATFYEEAALKLGALIQMTWGTSSDDASITVDDPIDPGEEVDVDLSMDIDWYEIKIAVGPTYELTEGVSIYGGPFYHMFRGDLEAKGSGDEDLGDGESLSWSAKMTADLEEQSNFGGYIGAQIDLAENLPVAIEYQFTSDATIFGASLVYRF